MVTLEFMFYKIDDWEADDKFTVIIDSIRIDLGQFQESSVSSDNPFNYEAGDKGGINWFRYSITPSMLAAFNSSYTDQAHKVELQIPQQYYADNSLEVEFELTMDDVIDNESAGIDNIKVTAHGLCVNETSADTVDNDVASAKRAGPHRVLDEKETKTELVRHNTLFDEPEWNGDDGMPYCSSEDYPCKGEKTVYICHYNPHLGYQTFCVPEEESDIVKFYVNSYCGPCVGGFGGEWQV